MITQWDIISSIRPKDNALVYALLIDGTEHDARLIAKKLQGYVRSAQPAMAPYVYRFPLPDDLDEDTLEKIRVAVRERIAGKLVVPKSAVVIRDNEEVLFRYRDGKALWTYVRTSLANSREYVVEANRDRGAELAPGDLIIVSGNLNLADGSEVTAEGAR